MEVMHCTLKLCYGSLGDRKEQDEIWYPLCAAKQSTTINTSTMVILIAILNEESENLILT